MIRGNLSPCLFFITVCPVTKKQCQEYIRWHCSLLIGNGCTVAIRVSQKARAMIVLNCLCCASTTLLTQNTYEMVLCINTKAAFFVTPDMYYTYFWETFSKHIGLQRTWSVKVFFWTVKCEGIVCLTYYIAVHNSLLHNNTFFYYDENSLLWQKPKRKFDILQCVCNFGLCLWRINPSIFFITFSLV